jgi:hypothetical protein
VGGETERGRAELSLRFVVVGASAAAPAGFAVALVEIASSTGWRIGLWGIDVLDAAVLGFTVGVVFTMAGIGLRLLGSRIALPSGRIARGLVVGGLLAALALVLGLLVLVVRPELWPDWPIVLIPAAIGGGAAVLAVAREVVPG